MTGPSAITVDLARGEIALGARRIALVSLDAGAGGTPARFRLSGDVVVRAITFGERTRLVREALADGNPQERLVGLLRVTALEGEASTLSDAVLLALAGGGGDAPAFERCAIDASRVPGWNWRSLHDTLALVVDGAVESAGRTASPGEWNRFIFPAADTREIDELLREMATRLLARGSTSDPERQLPQRVERNTPVAVSESGPPAAPAAAERAVRDTIPAAAERVSSPSTRWANGAAPAGSSAPSVNTDSTLAPGAHTRQTASRPPHTRRVVQRAVRRALPSPVSGGAPQPTSSTVTAVARASANRAASSMLQQGGGGGSAWPATTATTATATAPRLVPTATTTRRPAAAGAAVPLAQQVEPRNGLPALAPAAAPAFRPLTARTTSPVVQDGTREAAARVPAATGPALHDLLDEVARALAAECDLRGLDA